MWFCNWDCINLCIILCVSVSIMWEGFEQQQQHQNICKILILQQCEEKSMHVGAWSRACRMASELCCKAWTIVIMWLRRRAFRRGSREQHNLNSKLFIGSFFVKLLLGIESTAFDSFECMISFCVWPLPGFVFLCRGLGWGGGAVGGGGVGDKGAMLIS